MAVEIENELAAPAIPDEGENNEQEAVISLAPAPVQRLPPVEHVTQFDHVGPSTSTASTSTSTLPFQPPVKKRRRRRKKKLLEQQGAIKKVRKKMTGILDNSRTIDTNNRLQKTEQNTLLAVCKNSSEIPIALSTAQSADMAEIPSVDCCRGTARATIITNKNSSSNAPSNSEPSANRVKFLDEPSTSRLIIHDQALVTKDKSQPSPQYSRFDFLANSIIITDVTTEKGTITIKECSAYEAFFGPEPNRPE